MGKRFDVMGKVHNIIVFYDNETKTHKSLSPKAVIDLLNEQDEAIKMLKGIKRYDIGELLAENIKLKQQLSEKDKKVKEINKFISLFDCANLEEFKTFIGSCMLTPYEKEMSIIQLKKQLHTQPRKIVEKIKKKLENTSKSIFQDCLWLGYQTTLDKLDEILKEYEESDNEINID